MEPWTVFKAHITISGGIDLEMVSLLHTLFKGHWVANAAGYRPRKTLF